MKTLKLGNGLKITESEDMGVVLHFKTREGTSGGIFLDPEFAGYGWAQEMLADVPDVPDPDMDMLLEEVSTEDSDSAEKDPMIVNEIGSRRH